MVIMKDRDFHQQRQIKIQCRQKVIHQQKAQGKELMGYAKLRMQEQDKSEGV